MKQAILLLLAATFGAAPAPAPIPSEPGSMPLPCGPRDAILARLADQFGETPVAGGIVRDGLVVVLTLSPDGETWTLFLSANTDPPEACLISSGVQWRVRKATEEETPHAAH